MIETKHVLLPLRAYERNSDPQNWAIRDAGNNKVAEHIPKDLAQLMISLVNANQKIKEWVKMALEHSEHYCKACSEQAREVEAVLKG